MPHTISSTHLQMRIQTLVRLPGLNLLERGPGQALAPLPPASPELRAVESCLKNIRPLPQGLPWLMPPKQELLVALLLLQALVGRSQTQTCLPSRNHPCALHLLHLAGGRRHRQGPGHLLRTRVAATVLWAMAPDPIRNQTRGQIQSPPELMVPLTVPRLAHIHFLR